MIMQKKSKKSVFKGSPELGNAYKALFDTKNISSCSACGNDALDELGIYPSEGSGEWMVLCFCCYKYDKSNNNYQQREDR